MSEMPPAPCRPPPVRRGGKPPCRSRTFYTIGELADELDITTRAIRFYEAEGLIAPAGAASQRSYSRRDRARLMLILRGKNLGFTWRRSPSYLEALRLPIQRSIAQTQMLLASVEHAHRRSAGQARRPRPHPQGAEGHPRPVPGASAAHRAGRAISYAGCLSQRKGPFKLPLPHPIALSRLDQHFP